MAIWMGKIFFLLICFGAISIASFIAGCEEDTVYHCTYEVRSTGCGGKGWGPWKTECFQFDIEDYKEDWTPEKVCNQFKGSDTHCGGGCCIYVEYRNNRLSHGECPEGS